MTNKIENAKFEVCNLRNYGESGLQWEIVANIEVPGYKKVHHYRTNEKGEGIWEIARFFDFNAGIWHNEYCIVGEARFTISSDKSIAEKQIRSELID